MFGFVMICLSAGIVYALYYLSKGPIWDEPGYKSAWIIGFFIMGFVAVLTWLSLYKGYKLCRPPEEKEKVIELLGEKF
ncbi:hypothetical protein DF182_19445 [Chitinophaga flava]|uniref:Uncharacterized protein n=2 Tax=Chitinophaga flava TaxID=2259036 RepID=A0A365XSP8_9BACT|nr:hypothetical protein DF182_19445 [Chitinophaga flava]